MGDVAFIVQVPAPMSAMRGNAGKHMLVLSSSQFAE
jgi:hypothetical protein